MTIPLQRVLLVEDDADIRTVAGMALEMVGGLTVRVCDSGAAALAAIGEFAPQLVLADVMMPGMSGPELLAAMRRDAATAQLPVLFLTAKVQPDELQALHDLGALGVIAKPFDPMTLTDEVKAVWQSAGAGGPRNTE